MTKAEIRAMCDRVALIINDRLPADDGAKGNIADTSTEIAALYLFGDGISELLIEALDDVHRALAAIQTGSNAA